MKSYEALARVYDRLNGEVDYAAIADFYEKAFARYGIEPRLVLDLGCGTGAMTLELARRGYDMIGVDASAEMLSKAYERMWKQGAKGVLFLEQDMRTFELYGTVEAVVCTLDGVNHLTKSTDVAECFHWVHNYLVPNGIFVFDINTTYKFEQIFGNNAYILEDDGVLCAWQNAYDKKRGLCRFYLSLFEEEQDGSYTRTDTVQTERAYSLKKIKMLLADAGFELLFVKDGYTQNEPQPTTERLCIAARAVK